MFKCLADNLKKPSCIQTLSNMAACLPAPGDGVHHDHPPCVARVEPGVVDQPPVAPRLHHGAVAGAHEGAVNTLKNEVVIALMMTFIKLLTHMLIKLPVGL